VTPFAPRALDRGLAAAVVAMARLVEGALTPNPRAADANQIRPQLNWIADVIRGRVIGHNPGVPADVAADGRARAVSLLDDRSSLSLLIRILWMDVTVGATSKLLNVVVTINNIHE
jgi:hypothetical protein